MNHIFSKPDRRSVHDATASKFRQRFSDTRNHLFLVACLTLIVVIKSFVWDWQGARITPDSEAYIQAASSLIETGSLGTNYTLWPPLYPFILAILSVSGLEFAFAASILNFFTFIALLCAYALLFLRTLRSYSLASIALVIAAFSSPIGLVFQFAWSDTIFLLFSLFSLYFGSRFLVTRNRNDLIYAALALCASLLTRHAGIAVAFVLLVGFVASSALPSKKKAQAVSFVFIASIPYLVWMMRTWFLSGTLTGSRQASTHDFSESLLALSKVLGHWVFPYSFFTDATVEAVLVSVLLLILVVITARRFWWSAQAEAEEEKVEGFFTAISAEFILAYSFFIVVTAGLTNIDLPNDRYLSPVVFPLVLVLSSGYSSFSGDQDVPEWRKKTLRAFVAIWLCLWIAAPNEISVLLERLAM